MADEGLIWDDSALTITINPMQTDGASEESSDSDNTDSEDEDGTFVADIEKYKSSFSI